MPFVTQVIEISILAGRTAVVISALFCLLVLWAAKVPGGEEKTSSLTSLTAAPRHALQL